VLKDQRYKLTEQMITQHFVEEKQLERFGQLERTDKTGIPRGNFELHFKRKRITV
jgi:hypothetical protein